MREEGAPDRAIAEVAARQYGIVDRGQLLRIGLSSSAIGRRVAAGRLHPRHPGVYAVGHAVVSAAGVRWAAVLACGPGAVLSRVSAACAWCMLLRESAVVDVTVGRDGSRSRAGIRTHRRVLAADDVTELVGLPITTPERTLLDLAASGMRGRALERVVDQAERMRLADFGEVGELLERHRGAPGSRSLKTVPSATRTATSTRGAHSRTSSSSSATSTGSRGPPATSSWKVGSGISAGRMRASSSSRFVRLPPLTGRDGG